MKCTFSEKCSKAARSRNRGMCPQHYQLSQRLRRARGEWRGLVPAEPVQQRLVELQASGVTLLRIREVTGLAEKTLMAIPVRERVWSTTADKIMALDDMLLPSCGERRGRVPVLGTRRRLQSLEAMGYTRCFLAGELGMTRVGVDRLVSESAKFANAKATVATARNVDALWRRLQVIPPPNRPGNVAARNRSAKRGWALPFHWDPEDLDDPKAKPHVPQEHANRERLAKVIAFRAKGLNDSAIARELGIDTSTFFYWQKRHIG